MSILFLLNDMQCRSLTLRVSIFFFLLFTPFSSYMTILTHIYEQADLPGIGPATLASNYAAFILSSIVAPAVRAPLKLQLLAGGLFYTLNYSSGILAALTDTAGLKFAISCLGSGLAGLSAGFLWVSQGRYIHVACQSNGETKKKGRMYGLFSSIYCFSNVSAGVITTFGLGFFDAWTYFWIITALGLIACLYCLFFVPHLPNPAEKGHQETLLYEGNKNLSIQQVSSGEQFHENGLSSGQEATMEPIEIIPQKYSAWEVVKGTISFIPTMKAVLLVLLLDGFALGIYSSEITKLLPEEPDPDYLNKLAGLAMITLGVGSTFGGLLSGWVADKSGTLVSGRSGLILYFLSCLLYLLSYSQRQLWLSLCSSFFWGFALFYVQGWMYVVCSRSFGGRPQSFSVNKQLHSVCYLIFQITVFSTENRLPLYWIVGTAGVMSIVAAGVISMLKEGEVQTKK